MAQLRYVPEAALSRRSKVRVQSQSLDHLISTGADRGWDGEAERLGRLEVYYQLELGRRLNRQIAGLFALQGTANVNARLAYHVVVVGPVADQASELRTFIDEVHGWDRILGGQCDDLADPAVPH